MTEAIENVLGDEPRLPVDLDDLDGGLRVGTRSIVLMQLSHFAQNIFGNDLSRR